MLELAFNEAGYYARGEKYEAAQAVSPRVHPKTGEPVFHPLEHQYAVLMRALTEFRDKKVLDDIVVYNDSRIIEELNGTVAPMFPEMTNAVRRNLLPEIKGCVWFHKKPVGFVATRVEEGISGLVNTLDPATRKRQAERIARSVEEAGRRERRVAVNRFKQGWLRSAGSSEPDCESGGN